MKKIIYYSIIILSAISTLCSCKKNQFLYPYTEHDIIYMGIKSGLTPYSPDSAFNAGLNEIMLEYANSHPDSSTEFTIDKTTYDITNLQEATGGIQSGIWDIFWEDLEKYDYSIGSCWGFLHMHIPSKGGIGTAYFIYAIVKDEYYDVVHYIAVQGTVTPLETRSFSDTQNPIQFISDGNYPHSIARRPNRCK